MADEGIGAEIENTIKSQLIKLQFSAAHTHNYSRNLFYALVSPAPASASEPKKLVTQGKNPCVLSWDEYFTEHGNAEKGRIFNPLIVLGV